MLVHRRLHRDGRRSHRLAEHDQREQAVPLGDVVRVPGGLHPQFGDHRHGQLGQDPDRDHHRPDVVREHQHHGPADLAEGDPGGVAQRHTARRPLLGDRRAQPLGDHGQPHHHVADHRQHDVLVGEEPRHPGREDEHAGDLDQGGDPVRHVVAVVGGGEPGEIHPGPPNCEEREEVAGQPVAPVALGEVVGQLPAGLADGDHEAEVEEEFQRGGDPVRLLPAARDHPAHRARVGVVRAGVVRWGYFGGFAAHRRFSGLRTGGLTRRILAARGAPRTHRRPLRRGRRSAPIAPQQPDLPWRQRELTPRCANRVTPRRVSGRAPRAGARGPGPHR